MPNKLPERVLTASVLLVFLLKAIPVCAGAAEIKIASWNIYWLTSEDPDHHGRKANDYARLAAYANDLDADVIALQEVDTGFVRRVFPPQQYRIELSHRRDTRQRTGFAIRGGIRYRRLPDYRELSTKWGLRYGAVIELEVGGRKIDLMSGAPEVRLLRPGPGPPHHRELPRAQVPGEAARVMDRPALGTGTSLRSAG